MSIDFAKYIDHYVLETVDGIESHIQGAWKEAETAMQEFNALPKNHDYVCLSLNGHPIREHHGAEIT